MAFSIRLSYSAYERNVSIPDALTIKKLSHFFSLSSDLILGINHVPNNKTFFSNEEEELLLKLREITPKAKSIIDDIIDLDVGSGSKKNSLEKSHILSLPLHDLPVSAGNGTWLDSEDSYEVIKLAEDTVPPRTDYALTVRGDSMEPDFSNNSILFVQSTPSLESGELGIFLLNGEGFFKYLKKTNKKIELISINPNYSPILVTPTDEFSVMGRVIGSTDNSFFY